MIRIVRSILIVAFFVSCKTNENSQKKFEEKIVDFAIEQKNNRPIELKDLYDSLVTTIPEDKEEKIKLVDILKQKGFKITNYGRGNFFNGPRVVIVSLNNENCECEVAKYYYSTNNDSTLIMTESISCK